jgi:formyl-CoA transferase
VGNNHPTAVPTGVFPTLDGVINIAAHTRRLWDRFCHAINRPEWKTDPKWATDAGRSEHRSEINEAISEITKRKASAYWIDLFESAGIPCGPVTSIDKVFDDPQVKHLKMAAPITHPRLGELNLISSPINMAGVGRRIWRSTPDIGEHSTEILSSVGYTADEIYELRSDGVV